MGNRRDNKTGVPGVYLDKGRGKYYGQVEVNGKRHHIGQGYCEVEVSRIRNRWILEHPSLGSKHCVRVPIVM